MRVLVIEDDEELAETVAAGLRQARMAVDVALDGEAGLARALVHDYEVIVLDRDLPGLHGDQVCERLVATGGRSRVLMLDRRGADRGSGRRARARRRRLPDQTVSVRRVGRADRRARPTRSAEHPPGAAVGRCGARHRHPLGAARRPAAGTAAQGVRRTRAAARGAGPGRLRRGAARTRVGRGRGPFTGAVKVTISRLRTKLGDPPVIHTVARAGYRI